MTLLKDIFAHLVVERGKELAKLNNPKDAFVKQKFMKRMINTYTY